MLEFSTKKQHSIEQKQKATTKQTKPNKWFFMNQFFCPFRLRNPAKNIATNPNIACTRGKWSLWWFEPCISKELKTLTGGILKQKKERVRKRSFAPTVRASWGSVVLWWNSYPDESGLFQIANSLNDLWTLCESYAKDFCVIW